jgi:hypothetical protein
MDINFIRDSSNKNRFNIAGIADIGGAKGKKGISGYHGGVIGWISAKILHKTVPIQSKDKGIYYLNCKSLEKWQKRVAGDVSPATNIHSQEEVETMLQNIKTKTLIDGSDKDSQKSSKKEWFDQPRSFSNKNPSSGVPETVTAPQPGRSEVSQSKMILPNIMEPKKLKTEVPFKAPVEPSGPSKQINVVKVLKEGFSPLGYETLSIRMGKIAKSIKEYDQDDLNSELHSFYKSITGLVPIGRLAREYFTNQQYDKLPMIIKALEYIQSEEKRIFGEENSNINNLIGQFKDKFVEQEVPSVITPKKILQEGRSFGGSLDKINELARNIRDDIEVENEWSFKSSDLRAHVLDYVIAVDDVEPLIKLTRHFIDNKDTVKANWMVEALKVVESRKYLGEKKLEKLTLFLQTIGTVESPEKS